MKYTINENSIIDVEGKLRHQIHQYAEIHSEVRSCLGELKRFAPMEAECKQLIEVMEHMEEEMHFQQQLADALAQAVSNYDNCEERVVESAWYSTLYIRKADLIKVTIPHYENGFIRI